MPRPGSRFAFAAALLGLAWLVVPEPAGAQVAAGEADSSLVQDVHPQDTAQDRGLRIVSRDRRVTLRIVGSIRLTGIYDFNGLPSTSSFKPIEIPVGDANIADPRFEMEAKQTRFGFELDRRIEDGRELYARLEMDFNAPDQHLRLRHAFAQGGHFLIGQTWTTVADVASLPLTVDLEGPNSAITIRTPQIRYIQPMGSGVFAVAAESPDQQVAETESISVENPVFPDITSRYRKGVGSGHLQVGAIFRQFTYRDASGALNYVPAGGLVVSGNTPFNEELALLYQAVYGVGISRYIGTFGGLGLDLVPSEDGTELVALPAGGGYISFQVRWSDDATSNIVLGTSFTDKSFNLPDEAYRNGQYVAVNMFWEHVAGLRIGIEGLYGRRENEDGQTGEAYRLQFGTYFDF